MASPSYHLREMVEAEDRDRFCGRCGKPNPDPNLAPPRDWEVRGNVVGGNWELVCPDCCPPNKTAVENSRKSVQPPC